MEKPWRRIAGDPAWEEDPFALIGLAQELARAFDEQQTRKPKDANTGEQSDGGS